MMKTYNDNQSRQEHKVGSFLVQRRLSAFLYWYQEQRNCQLAPDAEDFTAEALKTALD